MILQKDLFLHNLMVRSFIKFSDNSTEIGIGKAKVHRQAVITVHSHCHSTLTYIYLSHASPLQQHPLPFHYFYLITHPQVDITYVRLMSSDEFFKRINWLQNRQDLEPFCPIIKRLAKFVRRQQTDACNISLPLSSPPYPHLYSICTPTPCLPPDQLRPPHTYPLFIPTPKQLGMGVPMRWVWKRIGQVRVGQNMGMTCNLLFWYIDFYCGDLQRALFPGIPGLLLLLS